VSSVVGFLSFPFRRLAADSLTLRLSPTIPDFREHPSVFRVSLRTL
jgi:hypothetical protein